VLAAIPRSQWTKGMAKLLAHNGHYGWRQGAGSVFTVMFVRGVHRQDLVGERRRGEGFSPRKPETVSVFATLNFTLIQLLRRHDEA
jgi:hypothetical protein